ncbi:MAG: ABC transporter substrate-binding protein [Lachnospiraceae bacterium]
MKKLLCLIMSVVLMMTCLTGCGSTGSDSADDGVSIKSAENTDAYLDPANPITVTFYSYSLSYPSMKGGMEHLIQSFNETIGAEKGIIVEGIADDMMSKFKSDIQAGNPVDIVQMPFSQVDTVRTALGFKAYEDVFPEAELSAHLEGISENALSLAKIDDKMYGLAFTFSTPILYINGNLFEEAGLDPENPPTTWDEMLDMAKTIKEKTGKNGFALSPTNGWVTEGIIYTAGSDIVNADKTEAVFANEETAAALATWKEFFTSGCAVAGTDNEAMQEFMAGNVAMHIQSTSVLSGMIASAEAGGWKLYGAAMPNIGEKEAVPVNSGSCLVVNPDSKEKTAAIWEFIKYVTGDEGYTIITSEIGYLPLRTYLADDPAYLKDFVDKYPLLRINLEQLDRIRAVTIWPGDCAAEAYTIFTDAIQKALTTDEDILEVLQKAQNDINALLQE